MSRRAEPDPELPMLALLRQALEAGMTRDQVRQRVRSGSWARLARGAYVPGAEGALEGLDDYGRARVDHMFRAIAAASRNTGTVVCDASAATMHGIRVFTLPPRAQLGVPPGRWSGTRSGIDFRTRDFLGGDVLSGRVPVASPLRCWVDITRFGSLTDSLTAGDSAVRQGLFDPTQAARVVPTWAGRRGVRRLMTAAALLDGARESPLESASFAYFVEHGIPLPSCQVVLLASDGQFLGRVDFLWEEARLVGECDGRMKYAVAEDVYAEKRREDAIRDEDYRFIRWGMRDLQTKALANRVRTLLR